MIIIRTQFDEDYFFSLLQKLNFFHKDFYATKNSNQFKKLYNLEHNSKLQGGQRDFEEHSFKSTHRRIYSKWFL